MTRIPAAFLSCLVALNLGCSTCQPAATTAPFVHVVLFKTRAADPEAASRILMEDIGEYLADLPTVKGLCVGRPAPTNTRPIVDANYDVGLLVLFEDQKGLQEYLDHPRHVEFARKHDAACDVRVFDFTPR